MAKRGIESETQANSDYAAENEHYVDFLESTRRRIEEDPRLRWEFEAERLKLVIASTLNKLREAEGLSQAELAKKSGTTQPMLSRFFSGEDDRSPTIETLVKIADAFGKVLHIQLVDRHPAQSMTWSRPEPRHESLASSWSGNTGTAITETSVMAVPVGVRWTFQRASSGAAITEVELVNQEFL